MSSIEQLKANGYNDDDIMELVCMFENQIKNFRNTSLNLSPKVISEELHRLKGGCDLLYLYAYTEKITKIDTASIESSELPNILILLTDLLDELLDIVAELKLQINAS